MKKKHILILIFLLNTFYSYALEAPRTYHEEEKALMVELFEIGIFNFDNTSWQSSLLSSSPYYVDLRHIMSYPQIFKKTIQLFKDKAESLTFDSVCGVPYAALPMAANLAYEMQSPLIMRRTQRKEYGIGRKLEGVIIPNTHCLVIEDVVTTATSLFETIHDLEVENLIISDCIVFFDREQGGVEYAKQKGYQMHVIFTISDFMYVLEQAGKIDSAFAERVIRWTRQNQVPGINWKNH